MLGARTIPSRFFKYRWVSQASKEGAVSKNEGKLNGRVIFMRKLIQKLLKICLKHSHLVSKRERKATYYVRT